MDRQEWLDQRNSRSLRYAGRCLNPGRWIAVTGDPAYLRTYEGQVAALVLCNLLGRMTPSVAVDLPDERLVSPLPWAGQPLADFALATMQASDPHGRFVRRTPQDGDFILYIGPAGPGQIVHGTGWDAWTGSKKSPLKPATAPNPFGAGLAAVLASARLFLHDLNPPAGAFLMNALDWTEAAAPAGADAPVLRDLGEIWFVGVGSVGSAAMYFLAVATRDFSASLFDMDVVKVHNLDRSPIFNAADADAVRNKVEAGEIWLKQVGVKSVSAHPYTLHEAPAWIDRQAGRPDVIVSAANEWNVRNFIEEGFPPIQLYATTGKNWQVSLIRHVPMKDPCSLCLFPNTLAQPVTTCASGTVPGKNLDDVEQIDAALPFLSFAAGLMTAAELTKLPHANFPYSENRIYLQIKPDPNLNRACLSFRPGCTCHTRSRAVLRKMIAGSRHARLSDR